MFDFWERIWTEICCNYNIAKTCVIYIHGDGANWIKSGVEYLPGSKFVLDKFHVTKALKSIISVGHPLHSALKQSVYTADRKAFKQVARACLGLEARDTEKQEKAISYCLRNWKGIQIWQDDPHCGNSCAAGLVNHYISDRMSSRPMAWLDPGMHAVLALKEYKLNGGKISVDHFRKQKEISLTSNDASARIEQKAVGSDFLPMPTEVGRHSKNDSLRRFFDFVKYGGFCK